MPDYLPRVDPMANVRDGRFEYWTRFNHRITYSFGPGDEGWGVEGVYTSGRIPLPPVTVGPSTSAVDPTVNGSAHPPRLRAAAMSKTYCLNCYADLTGATDGRCPSAAGRSTRTTPGPSSAGRSRPSGESCPMSSARRSWRSWWHTSWPFTS